MTDSSNQPQTTNIPKIAIDLGDTVQRVDRLLAQPIETPSDDAEVEQHIPDGKKHKPPRAKVMFRDLEIKRGYKTQVALVLYAILKTGVLTNRKTKKPITIIDFTELIRNSNMDLNIRNLCHRTILRPDPADTSTTTKFLRDIITTIEEHSQ